MIKKISKNNILFFDKKGKVNMTDTTVREVFFFSQITDNPIYDKQGKIMGDLQDMALQWIDSTPIVTCIKYGKGLGHHLNISLLAHWDSRHKISLKNSSTDITDRLLNGNEFYVGNCLLDKQIIDGKGSKLGRVNDILLSLQGDHSNYKIIPIAVDIGIRGFFRRMGLEFLFKNTPNKFLNWQDIRPLDSNLSNLHLTRQLPYLRKLFTTDIDSILRKLNHDEQNILLDQFDNALHTIPTHPSNLQTFSPLIRGSYKRGVNRTCLRK